MNSWRENYQLRGAVYALGGLLLIGLLLLMRHHPPPSNVVEENAPPAAASASATNSDPAQVNSLAIQARCNPELKDPPSAPSFEVNQQYNRVGIQMKVRFLVDNNGFVLSAGASGARVLTPADQEAALDYVRHLSFVAPSAEECQTIKMQMVGIFYMGKNSSGDWITVFDAHPVYTLSNGKIVVNPN